MIIIVNEFGKQFRKGRGKNMNAEEKIHISIIGSCVLRDIFNSKFVHNYAEYFKVDSYFARTTIPSIMSKPYDYDMNILEKTFNPIKFEYHYTECSKCMLSILENNSSDYLLLDFYADSYYGTYEYAGNYYSGWSFKRLMKLGVIDSDIPHRLLNFKHNSKEYFKIWCKSFDKFMEYVREYFPSTKIVINGIKGSNQITENGNVIGIQQSNIDIDKLNDFWKRLDAYCVQKYNIPIIQYKKVYTLNPKYIYGLGNEFVHFYPEYYEHAFEQLVKTCNKKQEKVLSNNNFVRNSNFEQGLKFWSYRNSKWKVNKKTSSYVLISEEKGKHKWKSIWCDPIEINGDGKTKYTLSFRINIKEKVKDKSLAVFGIRVFKKAVYKKYSEAIQSILVKIPVTEIQYGTDMRITYVFIPEGKFIRIAPHIKQDMYNIEFSEIQLERGESVTEYKQSSDDKKVLLNG